MYKQDQSQDSVKIYKTPQFHSFKAGGSLPSVL